MVYLGTCCTLYLKFEVHNCWLSQTQTCIWPRLTAVHFSRPRLELLCAHIVWAVCRWTSSRVLCKNCCFFFATSGLQLLQLDFSHDCSQTRLFVFVNSMKYSLIRGGNSHQPSRTHVDTILTAASNRVTSVHDLNEPSFHPPGSPLQGFFFFFINVNRPHSFISHCLASICKPTTSIVFLTARVLRGERSAAYKSDILLKFCFSYFYSNFFSAKLTAFAFFQLFRKFPVHGLFYTSILETAHRKHLEKPKPPKKNFWTN